MDNFDISDDVWGQEETVRADKVFTDRENPQEAFERKVRVLHENWKKTFYVLCYYGIGGIGKTSFIDKLCRVIRGEEGNNRIFADEIDCNYIRYDFAAKDASMDKLSILLNWRNQLAETDNEFKFYLFDSAVLLYGKKFGKNIQKDEAVMSLLGDNPWLNGIVTAAGLLPTIGWVSGVIQAMDMLGGSAVDYIKKGLDKKKYKEHLEKIHGMEAQQILDALHMYFILDMRNNMINVAKKPLVIFLDTYEMYVDNLNRDKELITEDGWFRKGRMSVVQSIPGILWVITGRERLYWAEDDERWGTGIVEQSLDKDMSEKEKEALAREHLEQHLLGELSDSDARKFLHGAGVRDAVLCGQLYKLTSGTPLFLDICVDRYHDLIHVGETPTIEMFGENLAGLISRYLSNMNRENREMAYLLASIGRWTDESARKIADVLKKSGMATGFTSASYREYVTHSFIKKDKENSYYMHDTVRRAVMKKAGKDEEEIVTEAVKVQLSLLEEEMREAGNSQFSELLGEYVRVITENEFGEARFCGYLSNAEDFLMELSREGNYDFCCQQAEKLYVHTKEKYPCTQVEISIGLSYLKALSDNGWYSKALKIAKQLPVKNRNLNMSAAYWGIVWREIGWIYCLNGDFTEAKELTEQALELLKDVYKNEHQDILDTNDRLVSIYGELGDYKAAKELGLQNLKVYISQYGENHQWTMGAMNRLIGAYVNLRDYENAKKLSERLLEKQRAILGNDHLDTLSTMNNLANAYCGLGDYEAARGFGGYILESCKRILGKEHPYTLDSMSNLAIYYSHMEKYEEAKMLREQVVEIRKRTLGEEHPDTLSAMYGLANLYIKLGDYEMAKEIIEQVLEVREKVLGAEHPMTIKTMRKLEALCHELCS